ncbi:MAG: hypothetical protein WC821_04010 [archaeon]
MPVTLRRHLATKKNAAGKRIVPFSGLREGVNAGEALKRHFAFMKVNKIKGYSTEVERGVLGAKTAQRRFGVKKPLVKLRKELGLANIFIDEKKAVEILTNKYGGDEVKSRNAWLKGDTLEGTLKPWDKISEDIVRRRFGLALAAEAGKSGAGRKGVALRSVLQDNVTHSWIVESVVQRLTKGMKNVPKMVGLPKETTGIKMQFVKIPDGRFRVYMEYEEFRGDVTRNFAECMLPSVRKYLEA